MTCEERELLNTDLHIYTIVMNVLDHTYTEYGVCILYLSPSGNASARGTKTVGQVTFTLWPNITRKLNCPIYSSFSLTCPTGSESVGNALISNLCGPGFHPPYRHVLWFVVSKWNWYFFHRPPRYLSTVRPQKRQRSRSVIKCKKELYLVFQSY